MHLTPDQKNYLLSLIETRYPNWQGVVDPRFEKDESSYKRKAEAKAKDDLSHEYLEGAIARGEFEEVVTRVKRVGERSQMLEVRDPKVGDLGTTYADSFDAGRFSRAVFALLYGNGDSSERLGNYTTLLEEQGWPSKWPLPTLLLSLIHPSEDFIVKPSRLDWIMKYLDPTFKRPTKPTGEAYARIKEMGRAIIEAFADKGVVDMIDAHSVVWAAAEGDAQRTNAAASHQPVTSEGRPFSARTFELLRGIAAEPTLTFYNAKKAAFKTDVEAPFEKLLKRVLQALNPEVRAALAVAPIFSQFGKSGFGEASVWTRYRSALPMHDHTDEDAHLSASVSAGGLEFGFFIGNYLSESRVQLVRNLRQATSLLSQKMQARAPASILCFGGKGHVDASTVGTVNVPGWDDFSANPERFNTQLTYHIAAADLLAASEADLVNSLRAGYENLFPLILLASLDSPMPTIETYTERYPEQEVSLCRHFTESNFLNETSLTPETMALLQRLLEDKRQLLLYGPPGTGKTWIAQRLAQLLTKIWNPPHERLEIVQFHPSYGYEDFMEGIRPTSKQGTNGSHVVDYPVRAGIFKTFCQTAEKTSGKCVFIIDEVNRGQISRILGELLYLLEYRDKEVLLPYSQEPFHIPKNVYIICTMNTADRSISLMDLAMRRRFHAYPLRADVELLRRWLESKSAQVPWVLPLYEELTKHAIDDVKMKIGPSHFMHADMTEEDLRLVWEYSILPYLEDYYIDDASKVEEWAWDGKRVKSIRDAGHGGAV